MQSIIRPRRTMPWSISSAVRKGTIREFVLRNLVPGLSGSRLTTCRCNHPLYQLSYPLTTARSVSISAFGHLLRLHIRGRALR